MTRNQRRRARRKYFKRLKRLLSYKKMEPIRIQFYEEKPAEPQVGDMWFCDRYLASEYARDNVLSEEYLQNWAATRPPLFVLLPGNTCFCIDSRAGCDNKGWKVEGMPPEITVHPSINIKGGSYHGFIRNGYIS